MKKSLCIEIRGQSLQQGSQFTMFSMYIYDKYLQNYRRPTLSMITQQIFIRTNIHRRREKKSQENKMVRYLQGRNTLKNGRNSSIF
jgi:hypothetical protein